MYSFKGFEWFSFQTIENDRGEGGVKNIFGYMENLLENKRVLVVIQEYKQMNTYIYIYTHMNQSNDVKCKWIRPTCKFGV